MQVATVPEQKESQNTSVDEQLRVLADILHRGKRDETVIQQTNPFLEKIGRALQKHVEDVEWDVRFRHRDVKQPQYLNRAWASITGSPFSIGVVLLPGELWWGVHWWGKRNKASRLAAAFQNLGLVAEGEKVSVKPGDIGSGWWSGAYFSLEHRLSADEVLRFSDEESLVARIADDLAQWYKRIAPFGPQLQEVLLDSIEQTTSEQLRKAHRKVVLIGAASEKRQENDRWLAPARELLARTGKVTAWWSYTADPEYIARLRESLPTWLYISYGGNITLRGRIVDFVGPEDEPLESPWPKHTLPEEQGRTHFIIPATGKEHAARMWFLLDRLESVEPPLSPRDFEPIGEKYRSPGPNHFAFVYEPPEPSPPPPPISASPISALTAYLSSHGYHFSPEVITTYYLSLQTKPFVILSGISGTGKTKLAQFFAEFISPPRIHEIEETVEAELGPDTFTLTVHPYMQKYGRVVIPVDAWGYFPELDLGERTRVRVRVGKAEENCQLSRQPHPQNPNGYIQLLFRGAVRSWFRDKLQTGEVIEVERTGPEESPVYHLRRRRAVTRRIFTRETFVAFIPVHPDWTDNRGLLGFQHLLTGTYHATDFLRLLLKAHVNWTQGKKRPYFVILDEMNLARVEHYFADFLSVLESRRWIARQPIISDETVTRWEGKKIPSITIRKDVRERHRLQDGQACRLRIEADTGVVIEDTFRLTSGGEVYLGQLADRFAGARELRTRVILQEDAVVKQDPLFLHDQPRCLLAAGNERLAEGYYDEGDQKTCLVRCRSCPLASFVEDAYHNRGEYDYTQAQAAGFNPLHFVPPRLEVPLNVYFSGTVNVDESTFTFSPKVLDRANVIEFGEVELDKYWREVGETGEAHPADEAIVRAFTHDFNYSFATRLRKEAHQDPALEPYRKQLATLVALLKPFHMHFGYRVADEIMVYLLNARRLNDPAFDLDTAFDHAILQKILPRFHGSRARLWSPLLRLLAFCAGDPATAEERAEEWKERNMAGIEEQVGGAWRLPRSAEKLRRMLRDLEMEGFTSFT